MDIALIIIGLIILIFGFIGNFLPILPWPIFSYLAFFLLQLTSKKPFSTELLIIFFIIAILVTTLDYVVPMLWTKKMGWSKRWSRGSILGLIISVIILPMLWITIGPFWLLWLIWWPFFGALIWETLYQNKQSKNKTKTDTNQNSALKPAIWSFLWFLSGIFLKTIYTIVICFYFFPTAFDIIKNLFTR